MTSQPLAQAAAALATERPAPGSRPQGRGPGGVVSTCKGETTVPMKKSLLEPADLAVFAVIAAIVAAVLWWGQANPIDYSSLDVTGITYPRGTVTTVTAEDLDPAPYDPNRFWGTQTLTVRLEDGDLAGEEVEIQNDLSDTHNVYCEQGTRVIVRLEAQEGLAPYYSIYNYDRGLGLAALVAVFAVLMVAIGRGKGFKSLVGLAFAIFLIACFMLPAFYHGYPVIPVTLAVVLAITVSSMTLLNGWSRKTLVAIVATMCGVALAAAFYATFAAVLHVGGYNMEAADDLIFIRQRSGFQLGDVLFTCVLVSSLGAVLDMTMSVTTALFEMKQVQPRVGARELVRSGLDMGRDMIGTMSQTLILAFAGGAITTLLSLLTYGTQGAQLLNSDYLTLEIFQSLIGSLAVILSVPLASLFSAWALDRQPARAA